MIIQGHPDILRGPKGLNGLNGFGSVAYDRFSAPGGAGVDALYKEIRDFVATHTEAEIKQAMAASGTSQTDIIQAFASVDAALPTGQSPALKRFLPENGGKGLPALYEEINDFANTHTLYELLTTMVVSGVSRADVNAANSYDFSQQQSGEAAAQAAGARSAAERERAALIANAATAEKAAADARAAGAAQAERDAQSALAARKAEADQAAQTALATRTAAAVAQAAQAAQTAQAAQAALLKLAAEAARSEAEAAAIVCGFGGKLVNGSCVGDPSTYGPDVSDTFIDLPRITDDKSPAYYRFLPENGGAGLEALYKEIRDFINTPGRTNAEIKQAMTDSGVSDEDIRNALKMPTGTGTGAALPLVVSAIAAYLLLG